MKRLEIETVNQDGKVMGKTKIIPGNISAYRDWKIKGHKGDDKFTAIWMSGAMRYITNISEGEFEEKLEKEIEKV